PSGGAVTVELSLAPPRIAPGKLPNAAPYDLHPHTRGGQMGFLDKLKGAVNAVTGGAAKVTMEFKPATAFPGDTVGVKITATSTGQEVKSKGIFVDLQGLEGINIKANATPGAANADTNISKTTFSQEFKIAPDFVL